MSYRHQIEVCSLIKLLNDTTRMDYQEIYGQQEHKEKEEEKSIK